MILLDTHVLVWMAITPDRLSRRASAAIQQARSNGALCISDVSLWEIAMLARRERIQVSGALDSFLHEISLPVVVKPITVAIVCMSAQFPENYPKDPADRLIGATSRVESLPLITADRKLRNSALLDTIW